MYVYIYINMYIYIYIHIYYIYLEICNSRMLNGLAASWFAARLRTSSAKLIQRMLMGPAFLGLESVR